MRDLSNEYLAGLFDGEGHIGISASHCKMALGLPRFNQNISICNTHEPTIKAIAERYAAATFTVIKANHRPVFSVRFRGFGAAEFLDDVQPYLIIKKRHAEILRLFLKTVGKGGGTRLDFETVAFRIRCYKAIRKLNGRDGGNKIKHLIERFDHFLKTGRATQQ